MGRIDTSVACIIGVVVATQLFGCGSSGGGGGETPSATTTTTTHHLPVTTARATTSTTTVATTVGPAACESPQHTRFGDQGCFYKCESDLEFSVAHSSRKGLDLDDTTLHWCPDNMHFHWPNTNEPVTSFRMFKAWAAWWNDGAQKMDAWHSLDRYLKASGGKVLVGTQISCNETEDDADWENVKEMVRIFGPEQLMGLAIGNELELLWTKGDILGDILPECLDRMWNQEYFLNKFHARVKEFDSLGAGFNNVKVTSVFGGFILAGPGYPFYDRSDDQIARIAPFLHNVTQLYGERYVHTLNIYPYFETKAELDNSTQSPPTCHEALRHAKCFEADEDGSSFSEQGWSANDCIFTWMVRRMRHRLEAMGNASSTLWIGETGWSYPQPETLNTPMARCADWSQTQAFTEYYSNFLQWDLSMKGSYPGPDHIFYFSMRDSDNFGKTEGFGLVGDGDPTKWCSNTTCKLQQSSWNGTTTTAVSAPSSLEIAVAV